jgi:hypothetical protein
MWRKGDSGDKERFIAEIRKDMKEDEGIVRVQVTNFRSNPMTISIEPQGSEDKFSSGAHYEIIARGPRDKSFLYLEISDDRMIAYCNHGWGAVFDEKGAATEAY